MLILGIETSCDETAAAVVEKTAEGKLEVLASSIATSVDMHAITGGIVPENAAREQVKAIMPVIDQAVGTSKEAAKKIDTIAVTTGPGLIGSLLVGVEVAKTLAFVWGKPIIPVNHLMAHIYAAWINDTPAFPTIALVVSGGHTDFVLMTSHKDVKWLGGTRDDAAGEAFDKTARLLGLGYPGGLAIAQEAEVFFKNSKLEIRNLELFPRPMIDSHDLDMSFSGLKTAVLNFTKNEKTIDTRVIATNIQEAIVDTIVSKAAFAVDKYSPKSFILSGGVSANKRLREKLTKALKDNTQVFIPEIKHSTDNAVMIAAAAHFVGEPLPWAEVNANPNLSIEDRP